MKIKITINIEKLEYDRAYPQWNAAELTTLTVRMSQINTELSHSLMIHLDGRKGSEANLIPTTTLKSSSIDLLMYLWKLNLLFGAK
jgi:hypothetical protein